MRTAFRIALCLTTPVALAAPVVAQAPTGPVLNYEMDVTTTSGFGAGIGSAMNMMMGGGGTGIDHTVRLRLGTDQQAKGEPRADHFFLPTVMLGKSVRLTGDGKPGRAEDQLYVPGKQKRPKGRILMFWGCGAKAGPGQPYVIDYNKMVPPQLPPELGGIVPGDNRRRPLRTNIHWTGLKKAPAQSSLLGAHRVVSNLGPDINFNLAQDYLAPLNARTTTLPDGSVSLRWTAIAGATGYGASAFGGMEKMENGGDVVFWTSAGNRDGNASNYGWLSPAEVAALIAKKEAMPPSQTSCQIPAEFKRAAGEMTVTMLSAYGPEVSFAYPPRPPAPAPWKPEWTAKVRFKAETTLMSGVQMGVGDADSGRGGEGEVDCKPKKKKGGLGGLGGMLGGAIGGALGGGSREGC